MAQISPLRIDPTRTTTLQRRFAEEIQRRVRKVQADINKLLIEEDAFGLKPSNSLVGIGTFIGNEPPQHKYGALILPIDSDEIREEIFKLQLKLDSADVLEYEREPHVTALYGFLPEVQAHEVEHLIDQYNRFPISLGRLSCFLNEEFDVLKIEVDSQILKAMNGHLRLLPSVVTHREFKGHLTLAYLKPGTGAKYQVNLHNPLKGKLTLIKAVVYSTPERKQSQFALNIRWKFNTNAQKLNFFLDWLRNTLGSKVLDSQEPQDENKYWEQYVKEGYEKGAGRAFDEFNKLNSITKDKLDFYHGSKYQFLKSSFSRSETVAKVKLLAGRVLTELKGVTDRIATKLSRVLADGLVQGQNPRDIAKTMSSELSMTARQAETIARTEIIRAHAEGAIDHYEELGVHELGVMVEWSTAGDGRVCPLCQALEGIVITTKEAKGMFPRHPNCRCTPLPANVLEDEKGQKRSKTKVQAAIDESTKLGLPKGKRDQPIAKVREESPWVGSDKPIDKNRPDPLLTVDDLKDSVV